MVLSNSIVTNIKSDFFLRRFILFFLLLETCSSLVSVIKVTFSHDVRVTELRMESVEGQDDEKRKSTLRARPVDTLKVAL